MTKKIRIENADTSNNKVVVQVWNKSVDDLPDFVVSTKEINNPADLVEMYVHGTQYLLVKEIEVSRSAP